MSVEVQGLAELRKALRLLAPDLAKAMDRDVKKVLQPIVKDARGYVPSQISGLSNWMSSSKTAKEANLEAKNRAGKFPKYNAGRVRAGIVASARMTKPNSKGFSGIYLIENKSAAGAIYETAGRKNPMGQPWNRKSGSHKYSHSRNKYAGAHFVSSIRSSGEMKGKGLLKGRLIYRAWSENDRYTVKSINEIVTVTTQLFARRVDAAKGFRKAA